MLRFPFVYIFTCDKNQTCGQRGLESDSSPSYHLNDKLPAWVSPMFLTHNNHERQEIVQYEYFRDDLLCSRRIAPIAQLQRQSCGELLILLS